MLTIDRRMNDTVYIGDKKITVVSITEQSFVMLYDNKNFRIKRGQSITIDNTEVFFNKQFNDKIRIGFDGPRTVRILRGELYNKDSQMFVDNSTKQFPSGGNY